MTQKSPETLNQFAAQKLESIAQRGLTRHLIDTDRTDAIHLRRNGRDYLSFCCNDYLNLARHPDVQAASATAAHAYGAGAGSSRLVTGNHSLLAQLERALADFKQTEDCVVFGSGYLANLGIIPTLVGPGDLVIADELSHACLLAGARISGAKELIFKHNDLEHLAELLSKHRGDHPNCLIVTDGVFSMDGDRAPVTALAALAEQHGAWLMTDDAHGLGTLNDGKGSAIENGVRANIPLQMGTLSKAAGSYGGYLCCSKQVADLIRNRARTLIYSTGLPPATVGASLKALEIIASDAERTRKPLENARLFCRLLNLPEAQSPIVPLILGAPENALRAAAALEKKGILVSAIRPPTVPEGTARLRLTFTAEHTAHDIETLADIIRTEQLI